ncbi:N-acetylmuramic acid 6-phosphate phosphatase MupP [Aurantivibrio infirmus]
MNLKAVLFDLDGTLLDTAPDFYTVVNTLREEESLSPLADEKIRASVSNGARALVGMAFQLERDAPEFDRLHNRLLELYSANLAVRTRTFPGIDKCLAFLAAKNIPWGIVTNKSHAYTRPILEAMQFNPPPLSIVCPEDVNNTKPDAEPLLLACKQMGCEANEAIYIGDHRRDIDCGKNAGSITVAAAYGYVDAEDHATRWQADHLAETAHELEVIIQNYLSE